MRAAPGKASRGRGRRLALAVAAVGCGVLAAAQVDRTVDEVESRTGAPVTVVAATENVPKGARFARGRTRRSLTLREVPERYAPRHGLLSPEQALGLEAAVPIPRGAYVTAPMLRDPDAPAEPVAPVRPGQRLVEVAARGGQGLARTGAPARVDVVVTTEGTTGRGRTFVALEDVELVAARPARPSEAADADGTPVDTVATLRVGARAAVFLTAAQNFARELRLLARPAGDRARIGRTVVGGSGL